MNSRTLILLLIALVTALAAALTARQLLLTSAQPQSAGPVAVDTIPVVVAVTTIEKLSKVRDADVKVIDYPKEHLALDPSLPGSGYNYFKDKAAVVGKFVTQTIYPGEPLVKQRLREDLGGGPLAHAVTLSQRAVALRVNDVSGVGGFLKHGDLVDILLTHRPANASAPRTDVIAQAIKVLAVDQDPSEDRDKPIVARTVTVEMNPQEAERVIEAMETGAIQLTLRNPKDLAGVPMRPPPKPPAVAPASGSAGPAIALKPAGAIKTLVVGSKVINLRCTQTGCQDEKTAAASGPARQIIHPPEPPAAHGNEPNSTDAPADQP